MRVYREELEVKAQNEAAAQAAAVPLPELLRSPAPSAGSDQGDGGRGSAIRRRS